MAKGRSTRISLTSKVMLPDACDLQCIIVNWHWQLRCLSSVISDLLTAVCLAVIVVC